MDAVSHFVTYTGPGNFQQCLADARQVVSLRYWISNTCTSKSFRHKCNTFSMISITIRWNDIYEKDIHVYKYFILDYTIRTRIISYFLKKEYFVNFPYMTQIMLYALSELDTVLVLHLSLYLAILAFYFSDIFLFLKKCSKYHKKFIFFYI